MVKAFRFAAVGAASGIAAQSLAAPAKAGNGFAVGAGLAGFGIGAILGSAPAPREVYVVLPPPPIYCGPVPYGPPPLTPGWYDYCRGAIRASARKRVTPWLQMGRPISAARAYSLLRDPGFGL
jgi:hypothetical protein